MKEYIIGMSAEVIERAKNGETIRITPTIQEVVRCRDCAKFSEQEPNGEIGTCELGLEDTGLVSIVEPDGFCAWGEKASNFTTCKCGEDIELGNRESAVCPSCGRAVIE